MHARQARYNWVTAHSQNLFFNRKLFLCLETVPSHGLLGQADLLATAHLTELSIRAEFSSVFALTYLVCSHEVTWADFYDLA